MAAGSLRSSICPAYSAMGPRAPRVLAALLRIGWTVKRTTARPPLAERKQPPQLGQQRDMLAVRRHMAWGCVANRELRQRA